MILKTKRLVLRPQEAGDAPALFAMLSDPEAMRFWSQPPIAHLTVVESLIAEQQVAEAEGLCRYWTMLKGEEVIGSIDLSLIRDGSAELGFLVHSHRWGEGFASEAAAAVVAHGVRRMGLKRLVAVAQAGNLAAARVLEKTGFTLVEERTVALPSGERRLCGFYLRED